MKENKIEEMQSALDAAYAIIENLRKSNDEKAKTIAGLEIYKTENERAMTQMAEEYQKMKKECDRLKTENSSLKKALQLTIEKEQLKTNELFGRHTENIDSLINSTVPEELIDEAETEDTSSNTAVRNRENIKHVRKTDSGRKRAPKKPVDLSHLPVSVRYLIDVDHLNAEYGEGNWRIAYWSESKRIEYPHNSAFVLKTYKPVISYGLEHIMARVSNCNEFYPGSMLSPSVMAEILYRKYALFLPLYRIEQAFRNEGLEHISRQTMSNWIRETVNTYLWMIYEYMIEQLMKIEYHQCDETPLKVINDGRPAGSISYVWLHTTSELCGCNPIIIYCYEKTRGTDHLRDFYRDFKGFITSDAYCSYKVIHKEYEEIIIVCGCLMHLRRRFVESLILINTGSMSEEQVIELTEVIVLKMIGEIYDADEALKNLSAEERKERRNKEVRPLMEKFYDYIEGLDVSDPLMTNRCKDAVGYALRQKEFILRFLDDGHIPLDNGYAERCIKSVALLRKASLFCYSVQGAEDSMIVHSIVETARANKANTYWYLRYLFETLPEKLDKTDRSFLKEMMPWSEEYKAYEEAHKHKAESYLEYADMSVKPKTPRKKDRVTVA